MRSERYFIHATMTVMRKFLASVVIILTVVSVNAQNTATNCYRGFVDAGYSIGVGDYEFGRFEETHHMATK